MTKKEEIELLEMKSADLDAEIKAWTIVGEYKSAIEDGETPNKDIAEALVNELFYTRERAWTEWAERQRAKQEAKNVSI